MTPYFATSINFVVNLDACNTVTVNLMDTVIITLNDILL